MKLYELLENTDIQSEYKVVYVKENDYQRTEITDPITDDNVYYDSEINYIYAENDIIYIEVEEVTKCKRLKVYSVVTARRITK